MKKILLLALVCVLAPLGVWAQTAVTGNLKDAGIANLTGQNTYARFMLENFGSNIPRVTGTNVIAVPYKDFKPDASGNISGTIQGNDTITPVGTFYQICLYYQGQQFRCANYLITGATFNLNSAVPLNQTVSAGPNQIVTVCYPFLQITPLTTWTITHNEGDLNVFVQTTDLSGNAIFPDHVNINNPNSAVITWIVPQSGRANVCHGGSINIATNQPNAIISNPTAPQTINIQPLNIQGTLTSPNVNKILFVDGITNTTLAGTLALCPAQGCYIFDSFQETLSANPFASCPAPNAGVMIFLSTNIISNVPIVNSCSGITIKGTGRSGSVGFSAGGSFPGSSTLFTVGDGVAAHFVQSSRLEDLSLDCTNHTTCTPYVGKNIAENSGVRNVAFTNYFGIGAQITTPASTNFQFEQTVFAPSATATAASGLQITGIFTDNNSITRVSCPFVALQQSGSCVDVENSSALLRDIHAEGMTNGVLVNNSHVLIEGYATGSGASGTITDHIKITGTGSAVVLDANACNPNYGTNLINNAVTGFTLPVATTCLLTSYKSGAAADGDIYFYPGIGTAGEIHTGDITASNLIAAKLGSSTAQLHTVPSVAADTYALLAAAQTFTNKTLTSPTVTNGTFSTPALTTPVLNGTPTGTSLQGSDTLLLTVGTASGVGKTLCLDSNGGASTAGCIAPIILTGTNSSVCTTGSSSLSTCDNTVNWSSSFADTSYFPSCMGRGPNDARAMVQGIISKATGSVVVRIVTEGSAAITFTAIECIGVHP